MLTYLSEPRVIENTFPKFTLCHQVFVFFGGHVLLDDTYIKNKSKDDSVLETSCVTLCPY